MCLSFVTWTLFQFKLTGRKQTNKHPNKQTDLVLYLLQRFVCTWKIKIWHQESNSLEITHELLNFDFLNFIYSTKPKEKEKLLVIPLIKRNDYGRHGNRQSDKSEKSDDKPTSDQIGKPKVQDGEQPKSEIGEKPKENNLEDDAVKEIIKG